MTDHEALLFEQSQCVALTNQLKRVEAENALLRNVKPAYVRMVIGEAISGDQVKEFARIYKDTLPALSQEPGFVRQELMVEEGGNMAVMTTYWETREYCLRYHSSRSYRQLVAHTQHLLAGNFVVKLFQTIPH